MTRKIVIRTLGVVIGLPVVLVLVAGVSFYAIDRSRTEATSKPDSRFHRGGGHPIRGAGLTSPSIWT